MSEFWYQRMSAFTFYVCVLGAYVVTALEVFAT